jgi:hypothetical protein
LVVQAFSAHQSQDEAAIRNRETSLQEAWNHHDAKAFAKIEALQAEFAAGRVSFEGLRAFSLFRFRS